MRYVPGFITADEVVYGSDKHKLEYNPVFSNYQLAVREATLT